MITYEWQKPKLEKEVATGIIKTIHWRYAGTEDDITADVYGVVTLPAPNAKNFIEWEDMTNTKVYSWLESILDVEQLETQISAQIEEIKNPKIIFSTLE